MNSPYDEQIEAILTGRALQYACEKLGVSHMARSSYTEVFTVKRDNIEEYFERNGIPVNSVARTSGHGEGIHLINEDGKWKTFWQERGVRYDEEEFESEEGATRNALQWLLRTSGTGLQF